MSSKKEKKEHYVNSDDFKKALQTYYDSDVMTEILGVYIKKIATGLSYLPNFINYTYKDDMIGDALIKMYSALKNKKFDFSSGSNPFSYFTTIAFHAFINRIKKEQKHHETITNYKSQVYESMMTDPEMSSYVYVKPENDGDDMDSYYNEND
jgi:DNA-directed RNA polymerase specialized sigma24 family protein